MWRTNRFTAAGSKGDAQAFVSLFQEGENRLYAFFLVVAELDGRGERARRCVKSLLEPMWLMAPGLRSSREPRETPSEDANHGTWLCDR